MRKPRLAFARRRARTLLSDAGESAPPVDVERLASLVGAEIRLEPYEGDLDGMLIRRPSGIVIGVNAGNGKSRQRFTIAHELGHLLLHTDNQVHLDEAIRVHRRDERSSRADDPDEIEANQFAAELLMPAYMLHADLAGIDSFDIENDATIDRLAREYQVSLQAMTIRLTVLGLLR